MAERSDDLLRSRQEAAILLRLDPENLSPSDALRCDLIATLRLSIDAAQSDALEGRAADLGRLIVATESLVKLLPSDPPKPAANHDADPRQVMWEIYKTMRERGELGLKALPEGQDRIAELEAENERLKAQLAGGLAPALLDEPTLVAITPSEADITPPSEWRGVPPMRGPDDPKPPVTIEAKAVRKPPAAPAAPQYDYNVEQGWRDYVLPDGTITPTPMSRGRWWGPV
jgi:hypothetical protein